METALTDMNGVANTQCLTRSNDYHNHSPANHCKGLKVAANGAGASNWYLPAAGELALIRPNYTSVNEALKRLADSGAVAATKLTNEWYWSSTEYNSESAWGVQLSKNQYTNPTAKDVWQPARCFLAF